MKNKIKLHSVVVTQAVIISSLALLSGCHDHTTSSQPVDVIPPEKPTETQHSFLFRAHVDHNEAAGSDYVIQQPQTNWTLSGTVDNAGEIQAVIPPGVALDSPLQVSVAMSVDTYKYLSEDVDTLETISERKAMSRSAEPNAYRDNEVDTPLAQITLQSTAEYALADKNFDQALSDEEIAQMTSDSALGSYQQNVQDLMVATEVIHQHPSKLYYPSSYDMMADFVKDEAVKRAFFATNSDEIHQAKRDLFNIEEPENPESTSFLRLDERAWPIQAQTLSYQETPWTCVDDIRRVSSRDYGTRLWYSNNDSMADIDADTATNLVSSINQSYLCQVNNWKLPTVKELSKLFKEAEFGFPLTFPAVNGQSNFWVVDENHEIAIANVNSGALQISPATREDKAQILLHSFTPYEMWFNIPATDTPVDIAKLRADYSQDPSQWPAPTVDEGVAWQELGLKPAVPFPQDNPYSSEKVALGKKLFFDPQLSKDNSLSCASCHDPAKGWADGIRQAVGINGQKGPRNTPTIINTAYYQTLFLDGRLASLEEQSLHPIANPIEMGLPHNELVTKLDDAAEYAPLFEAAFGDNMITLDRIAKAIATFERTIISKESDFDRFLKGDASALNDEQLHGLHLYRTKARCMNCHSGPMMSNQQFENIGLTYYGRSLEDRGRFNVTYRPEDMGKFRVPMLRDIKATDPTTHLGLFKLATVIPKADRVVGLLAMYNNGMTRNRSGNFPQYAGKYDKNFPEVSPLIQRLGMTDKELMALNAFMSAVSSDVRTDSASAEEMGIAN
ncbi:cytochrome c peroxidase [Vibrio sp. TRT 17S01]|uniref:cytochrome c peroxidase n=1 Tax=Vibrio sp. TRT 17S01 TaxID=3418505 RepID=UPI003CF11125